MSELIVLNVCTTFCSLLLSKAVVLLELSQLKRVLEICGKARGSCCGSKEGLAISAEREAFKMIKSLNKEEVKLLRTTLIEGSGAPGVNIVFDKTKNNIII
tara:strand:+ start:241 stop:543 length:303 start_codon:yes stop_codon:yes gene_type:complete